MREAIERVFKGGKYILFMSKSAWFRLANDEERKVQKWEKKKKDQESLDTLEKVLAIE